MADFSDKRLRTAFENIVRPASAEDLALLSASIKPLLTAALKRIEELSNSSILQLDPLPAAKSTTPPKADE